MKPLSQSAACAAKCLFAVMQYMKSNGGTVTTKEINDIIQENVKFTEGELERAGKLQNIRWWTMTQFYSIDYNKAGYILKKQGSWYLTPEGEEAIKLGAEQILRNANAAYRTWKQEQDLDEDYAVEEETLEKETIINIEQLEEQANEGIRQYIKAKNMILEYLQTNDQITSAKIQEMCGFIKQQARCVIDKMSSEELIDLM